MLMTEDLASKTSLAQKLANPAFLRIANALAQFKASPFSTPGTLPP
jgi:hypothetical protein